jgi:transcriptional regulator with XRE-family HTH domain
MGYRLKEIREEKKITQEELEKLSGVSRQTISAIENNDNYQAKAGTLLALAQALDTTVDSFLFTKAV